MNIWACLQQLQFLILIVLDTITCNCNCIAFILLNYPAFYTGKSSVLSPAGYTSLNINVPRKSQSGSIYQRTVL